jgi:hypothetical protein
LPNINIQPVQEPAGARQREVSYSDDDDTLSEYSSHGKQHDFFDSDPKSDTEPGKVLENTLDEMN